MAGKSGFMKDALVLFAITLIAGISLGGVYEITKAPIAQAIIDANNKAYKAVFADADEFKETEELKAAVESCNIELAGQSFGNVSVEKALSAVDGSGQALGYVVTSLSKDGYGGVVKISVGIKEDGTVTGVEFLEISETPGLGLKAKEPAFKDQYTGKTASAPLAVTKSGAAGDSEINSISGATITSSAVTNAVNAAFYYVQNCVNN